MDAEFYELEVQLGHRSHVLNQEEKDRYKDLPPPMTHSWYFYIQMLDERYAKKIFDKIVVNLHETFKNNRRVFRTPPYRISEFGYGNFLMSVEFHLKIPRNKMGCRARSVKKQIFLQKYDYLLTLCELPKTDDENVESFKIVIPTFSESSMKAALSLGARPVPPPENCRVLKNSSVNSRKRIMRRYEWGEKHPPTRKSMKRSMSSGEYDDMSRSFSTKIQAVDAIHRIKDICRPIVHSGGGGGEKVIKSCTPSFSNGFRDDIKLVPNIPNLYDGSRLKNFNIPPVKNNHPNSIAFNYGINPESSLEYVIPMITQSQNISKKPTIKYVTGLTHNSNVKPPINYSGIMKPPLQPIAATKTVNGQHLSLQTAFKDEKVISVAKNQSCSPVSTSSSQNKFLKPLTPVNSKSIDAIPELNFLNVLERGVKNSIHNQNLNQSSNQSNSIKYQMEKMHQDNSNSSQEIPFEAYELLAKKIRENDDSYIYTLMVEVIRKALGVDLDDNFNLDLLALDRSVIENLFEIFSIPVS